MTAVICGVNGCSRRLQPVLKVDPRDRDTWLYPECDECGRPACDRCRRDAGPLLELGLGRLPGPGG